VEVARREQLLLLQQQQQYQLQQQLQQQQQYQALTASYAQPAVWSSLGSTAASGTALSPELIPSSPRTVRFEPDTAGFAFPAGANAGFESSSWGYGASATKSAANYAAAAAAAGVGGTAPLYALQSASADAPALLVSAAAAPSSTGSPRRTGRSVGGTGGNSPTATSPGSSSSYATAHAARVTVSFARKAEAAEAARLHAERERAEQAAAAARARFRSASIHTGAGAGPLPGFLADTPLSSARRVDARTRRFDRGVASAAEEVARFWPAGPTFLAFADPQARHVQPRQLSPREAVFAASRHAAFAEDRARAAAGVADTPSYAPMSPSAAVSPRCAGDTAAAAAGSGGGRQGILAASAVRRGGSPRAPGSRGR
jgi:hypothetical protein